MTSADWVVLAAGIAAIAWVNWYFFLAERGKSGTEHAHGQQHEGTAGHQH